MASDPYDPISRIIGVESGGDANARNPNSSATGAGQFIESTWLSMLPKYRPDLTEGKSRAEILALRTDPQLSRAMTEAYANENGGVLTRNGHQVTPGNTYLAHFAGPQGAVKVLGAAPNAPVSAILGQQVVKANPFLANMTAADLRGWADRKMGSRPALAPAGPPLSAPVGQPLSLNPASAPQMPAGASSPNSMPAYGWSPNNAPTGTAESQPSQPSPGMDPIQSAQMLGGPPRRPPDLTQFLALLQRTPPRQAGFSFSKG